MTRGKIMRDTNAGPGIIFVSGEQKPFTLENHWKSSTPPKVGAVVEIELDAQGNMTAVSLVDEASLAKEQAQKALNLASENGKQYFGILVGRVGMPTLVAIGLLTIAWLFFATMTVQVLGTYSESISFYDVLKLVNSDGNLQGIGSIKYAGAGLYGLLMYVVILAPVAPHFHSNKYLQLGYCAPLIYMVGIGLSMYLSIKHHVSDAQSMASGMLGQQAVDKMMSEMISMTLQAISMGFGFYISALVATYLAAIGVKKYLASGATV
jgi:hypothetical protein